MRVRELGGSEAEMFAVLRGQIRRHRRRNLAISTYADAKQSMDRASFSVPSSMSHLKVVIGWPEKAVSMPARWIKPTGFRQVGSGGLARELNAATDVGYMRTLERMAIRSSMRHGVAFMFATRGDTAQGEPQVVYSTKSALEATAVLNMRTLQPTAALEVSGRGSWVMYLGRRALSLQVVKGGGVVVTHETVVRSGRTPCVPFVWGRTLEKPFGQSRITAPVMGFTDMGVRTLLRLESTAEGYSAPRRALMGAREEMFYDADGNRVDPLTILATGIWGIPDFWDEDSGEWRRAELEQLTQGTMQPHLDQLRGIASMYAGETSIPKGQIGIFTDNPSSADAIRVEEAPLASLVEDELDSYRDARMDLAYHLMCVLEGDSRGLREELGRVRATFAKPGTQTVGMQADMASKFAAANPWAVQSDVALEMWPLTEDQIERLKHDRDRLTARDTARELIAAARKRVGVDDDE